MTTLFYETAGESHGPALLAWVAGMPAGVRIHLDLIQDELHRRQGGFGRSNRQRLETDKVQLRSGVRQGLTIGSPIVLEIPNRDHRIDQMPPLTTPRPGHADFSGSIKWLTPDCRSVIERASARETAARVAAGAVAKCLLKPFGIVVAAFVEQIGTVRCHIDSTHDLAELIHERDESPVYCPDSPASSAMTEQIKSAQESGDTLGGILVVHAINVPPGLGNCMRWQDRLDGRLLSAVGSIQAIKGVEIGSGFALADRLGSGVHDAIRFDPSHAHSSNLGYVRQTNHAGGIEGGMTNGQPIVIRAVMKPINTLHKELQSVNLQTGEPASPDYERADVCAVPAASVVAENVVAFELARAFLEKFGGDTLVEVQQTYQCFMEKVRALGQTPDPNREEQK